MFQGVSGFRAVAGRAHHGKFAHRELAEHCCTGFTQALGDCCVGVGDAVVEAEAAVGCSDTLGVAQIFQGDGNAVKGAAGIACSDFSVGVFGLLEGEVGGGGEEGVEGVVKGVDSIYMGLSQLNGG